MHGSHREGQTLEGTDLPADLGHAPADLVVLSLSDSDLNTFAAVWDRAAARGPLPSIRMVNLSDLVHPLSVDLYVEQTLQHARGVLVRLIGGVPYWAYGLRQVHKLARERGIALAVVPAAGRKGERPAAPATGPADVRERVDAAGPARRPPGGGGQDGGGGGRMAGIGRRAGPREGRPRAMAPGERPRRPRLGRPAPRGWPGHPAHRARR